MLFFIPPKKLNSIRCLWIILIFQGGSGQEVVTKVVEVVPTDMINIPSYARWFVRMAGVSGASAVALGAYGAHGEMNSRSFNFYWLAINLLTCIFPSYRRQPFVFLWSTYREINLRYIFKNQNNCFSRDVKYVWISYVDNIKNKGVCNLFVNVE